MSLNSSQPKIISASRRTDIPAFYGDWMINRIKAGSCQTINPFNGRIRDVSLRKSDCRAIYFWTRNPSPFLSKLRYIHDIGYRVFVHFTILDYPHVLDAHCPDLDQCFSNFRSLSTILGPGHVFWRYDPIIISRITPPEYHIEKFTVIASQLQHLTDRCYVSFVDFYGKTKNRFSRLEKERKIRAVQPDLKSKKSLLQNLAQIARKYDLAIHTCCEDDLIDENIFKGHCIGGSLVTEPNTISDQQLALKPTREECGCYESIDIGVYDSCLFDCIYCYATRSHATARKRFERHDPDSPLLIPKLK